MNADFLEDFLKNSPEFQWEYIRLQRRLEKMKDERDRQDAQRQVMREEQFDKLVPKWRQWIVGLTWWLYCKSMPKFMR